MKPFLILLGVLVLSTPVFARDHHDRDDDDTCPTCPIVACEPPFVPSSTTVTSTSTTSTTVPPCLPETYRVCTKRHGVVRCGHRYLIPVGETQP